MIKTARDKGRKQVDTDIEKERVNTDSERHR